MLFGTKYNPATDIPDLTGKVAVITGGNTGVGYYTVAELVKHGAKVYMGSRSESRAVAALAKLKAEGYLTGSNGSVEWLKVDLSTPASSKAAAHEFLGREGRLDILVNNAGLLAVPENFTPVEGAKIPISAMMATNHVGPFVFTTMLLPLIKETAAEPGSDVRVVTVSSGAHSRSPKMDWTKAEWDFKAGGLPYNFSIYGTSKLANLLFAKELQRRFDEEGIDAISTSLHPGSVYTENSIASMASYNIPTWTLLPFLKMFGSAPHEGAYTSLFAATSPKVKQERPQYAGAYLTPVGVITQPSKEARDPQAAKDLWETTERIVAAM